ncbi:hypothetical protein D1631_07485 [Chryseobacterium nematophagum]|uniref:Uncharacterized protein n=1 Tax=Chryseobacterium nematophagum TaxID=2305228 RepID=A0A3M7TFC0_9FLAO|nr:hypothetical protein [Chryseobacterium nematophagum]RNA61784.1 hypothetical protein D1631_07485 [Chryseobacterium nematophagum]
MKNILLTIFVVSNLVACGQKNSIHKSTKIETIKMKSTGDKEIDNLISKVKISMENYMKEAQPPYSQKDIDECTSLLTDYTTNIFKTHSKEETMSIVKTTVLNLNTLNDRCNLSLIETDEREKIVEIMNLVSHKMEYSSADEDITEEWREF